MSDTNTNTQQWQPGDLADELEPITMTEPTSAYGAAWRERFTSHRALNQSAA